MNAGMYGACVREKESKLVRTMPPSCERKERLSFLSSVFWIPRPPHMLVTIMHHGNAANHMNCLTFATEEFA